MFVKERPVRQYVTVKLPDDGRISRPKHVVNYCKIFMVCGVREVETDIIRWTQRDDVTKIPQIYSSADFFVNNSMFRRMNPPKYVSELCWPINSAEYGSI